MPTFPDGAVDVTERPTSEAYVAARVVLVICPPYPGRPNSAMSPRHGWDIRAQDRFPTLKTVEGPFVNGVIAFTWEEDPAGDDELSARSSQIVDDELHLDDEWDGYGDWYGPHEFVDDPAAPGHCAFRPRDVHNQLKPCGETREDH